MTKKIYLLALFVLFMQFSLIAQSCDPGDPGGPKDPMGSPVPPGNSPNGPGSPTGPGSPSGPGGTPISIPVQGGKDPNAIIGTAGYDTTIKWVSMKNNLPYKIYFENDPEQATGPAQKVVVYLPIHPKLNPASFRLGDFGFGSFNFTVPENSTVYTNRLDLRDSLGLYIDVTAGLDITNRRAFWIFESIDPATGLSATLPPNSGFLPINDSITHKGEGYVTLTLQPVSNAQTGDTATAQATIIFDTEEPIATNTWKNTIDAVAPTSRMSLLPAFVNAGFPVKWSGRDDSLGSGLKNYTIYYSKNNGPFTSLWENTDSTGLNFPGGDIGAVYSFYSIATDNTGNREAQKNSGENTTTVQSQPNICPGSSTTFAFTAPGNGYSHQWQVDMGNGFVNISNGGDYDGANTNTLRLINPPTSWYGYRFRCLATNSSTTIEGSTQVLKFANTWFGAASAAWENPANWSCNTIPDENTDVIVNSNVPHSIRLNSNGTCRSLTLSNGAIFTITAGHNLNVTGK